jgi:hypothetical protein
MPKKAKRALSYPHYCALAFGNDFFRFMGPVFPNETEYREAWQRHRDEMLAGNPGKRPAAWWQFDAPDGLERPGDSGEETILLYEHGLLSAAEIKILTPRWRRHWEEAVEAHREWAGVPREVWDRFDRERAATIIELRP